MAKKPTTPKKEKKPIKRRIFIESDILKQEELNSVKNEVENLCEAKGESCLPDVFDEAIDRAWHNLDKTWASVKKADEIYANSSLMPLTGNSYTGAPVIFNGMMERAIKENITGKEVYVLRPLKDIYWGLIDLKLMPKAFKKNKLFMYDDDYDKLIEITPAIIKTLKK